MFQSPIASPPVESAVFDYCLPGKGARLLIVFCASRAKFQCRGVNTIALASSLSRAVIEEVSQVRPAILANHLGSGHKEGFILMQFYIFPVNWTVKAGPAGS